MATTSNQPVIHILLSKLQDERASRTPDLSKYASDAEYEYEEMCRRLRSDEDIKQLKAIDEMIMCLRSNQVRAAQSHARRAEVAVQFYQKTLKKNADKRGILDSRSSGGQVPQAAQRKPNPDYNNYDPTEARRDQMYGQPNVSREDQYRNQRRERSPPRQTPQNMSDTDYRAEQREDLMRSKRSSQKREEAGEEERMRRQLDQMSDSMEASVRLRKDNPNLTDLSDSLRPTKLAEKYTELYDNDWTDAFEELHNKCRLPEEKVVQCLLKILKKAYDRSCRKASEQINEIEDEVRRLMTRFKVNTNGGVSETKYMFRGDIGALRQYRKSLAKLSVPELQQTFASSYLRDILHQYGCHGNLSHTLEYTNKCVELTWLMSVQDPPVVLDMEDHRGFHTEKYKAFTKHGRTLDFYVWPALLLHEGGLLLAKGVAQGK